MLTLSPKTSFFIFVLSVGIIIFVMLDLVNIHIPVAARFAIALIAIALYILASRIRKRISPEPR
jgi:putative flippase GtrA